MDENSGQILDRRHRKRMQNRVAQRTYRNRIKQRVEELEREVEVYRSQANGQARPHEAGLGMSEGSALIITPSSDDDGPASGKTRQEAEDMHQDMVEEAGLFDLGMAVDNTDPQTREQQRPLDTQSPSTILQDSSIIHNSAMKPQAQQHTMLPANAQQHRGYTQTPVITSPGSTSQTFNISVDWPWEGSNMGSFRPEQTNSNIGLQRHNHHDFTKQHTQEINPAKTGPAESDSTYFTQSNATSSRRTPDRASHGMTTPLTEPDGPANESRSSTSASIQFPPVRLPPPGQSGSSIEDRLEFLQKCIVNAGFSSLDEVVGLYYTADLSHNAAISREQRKSRQTRLPRLLETLRMEAEAWNLWEAYGYQHEIIQSAASVIRDESEDQDPSSKDFLEILSRLERLTTDADSKPSADKGHLHQAFHPLMRMVQDTSPKLWTLVEALIGTTDDLSQMQKSYVLLSIIIILSVSKHKDYVREGAKLATTCLSIVEGL